LTGCEGVKLGLFHRHAEHRLRLCEDLWKSDGESLLCG